MTASELTVDEMIDQAIAKAEAIEKRLTLVELQSEARNDAVSKLLEIAREAKRTSVLASFVTNWHEMPETP